MKLKTEGHNQKTHPFNEFELDRSDVYNSALAQLGPDFGPVGLEIFVSND